MFPGLPGVLVKLLPPSVGGPIAGNDNAPPPALPPGRAARLAELDAGEAPELPELDEDDDEDVGVGDDGEEEEEGPATERDPAPWGETAAPTPDRGLLKVEAEGGG